MINQANFRDQLQEISQSLGNEALSVPILGYFFTQVSWYRTQGHSTEQAVKQAWNSLQGVLENFQTLVQSGRRGEREQTARIA